MIRIDEIYNNVFLPLVQDQKGKSLHWFDPFGSTDFEDMCSFPPVVAGDRFMFWDQEPVYQDRAKLFFDQFISQYARYYCLTRNAYRFYSNVTIVTSEYNSDDVQWLCDTYNLQNVYYFFHGWAALDWYRGYNKTFLYRPKNIKHTFLCPNNIVGGKRHHRIKLFNELCKRNLIENNLVSMPEVCPYEGIKVKDYIDYNVKLPLQIDDFDNYANNSHNITMWKQAAESLVHVVTETSFYGNKNFLTEKTFKPIVLKQPFILVSNRGSLEYLRRYGFKTFEGIWDESYDQLPDDKRISAIGNLLEELEHSNCKEWLHEQCAPIIEYNYNHFYGGGFEQILWDELNDMVKNW